MQNYIQCIVGFKKDVVATHAIRAHKYEHVAMESDLQLMKMAASR